MVSDYVTEYPALTVSWQVLGAANDVLGAGCIPCAAPSNSLREVGVVSWRIPPPSAVTAYRSPSYATGRPCPPTATRCRDAPARSQQGGVNGSGLFRVSVGDGVTDWIIAPVPCWMWLDV